MTIKDIQTTIEGRCQRAMTSVKKKIQEIKRLGNTEIHFVYPGGPPSRVS